MALFSHVHEAGGQLRAVGGCVRDFIRGSFDGDVDFATTLSPEAMMALAARHGIKAVPTGVAHGTITLVINGKGVEVTTLRRDVATDGRHATVTYTDRFEEDAARRDFTINALYMDARGEVYDYFGGQEDIAQQRLRFIGDATQRITEDALRILRYFRFLARLGWKADGHAVTACKANAALVEALSGERIQQEMKKLLQAPNPTLALQHMIRCGLPALLTDTAWDSARMPALLAMEAAERVAPHWAARLLLIAPELEVERVVARWKLSNHDKKMLQHYATLHLESAASVKEALRHYPREQVASMLALTAARGITVDAGTWLLLRNFVPPAFPVAAQDLLAKGFVPGEALGKALKTLEQRWIASDYTLSKAALIASIGAD